jgi:hypothetical protein
VSKLLQRFLGCPHLRIQQNCLIQHLLEQLKERRVKEWKQRNHLPLLELLKIQRQQNWTLRYQIVWLQEQYMKKQVRNLLRRFLYHPE